MRNKGSDGNQNHQLTDNRSPEKSNEEQFENEEFKNMQPIPQPKDYDEIEY